MKGMLDKVGWLMIERAGTMKHAGCPFSHGDSFCGDWCALFGEIRESDRWGRDEREGTTTRIPICNTELKFTEFSYQDRL